MTEFPLLVQFARTSLALHKSVTKILSPFNGLDRTLCLAISYMLILAMDSDQFVSPESAAVALAAYTSTRTIRRHLELFVDRGLAMRVSDKRCARYVGTQQLVDHIDEMFTIASRAYSPLGTKSD